jgi:hypothetical protein
MATARQIEARRIALNSVASALGGKLTFDRIGSLPESKCPVRGSA